jgi:hypothetical protein
MRTADAGEQAPHAFPGDGHLDGGAQRHQRQAEFGGGEPGG